MSGEVIRHLSPGGVRAAAQMISSLGKVDSTHAMYTTRNKTTLMRSVQWTDGLVFMNIYLNSSALGLVCAMPCPSALLSGISEHPDGAGVVLQHCNVA